MKSLQYSEICHEKCFMQGLDNRLYPFLMLAKMFEFLITSFWMIFSFIKIATVASFKWPSTCLDTGNIENADIDKLDSSTQSCYLHFACYKRRNLDIGYTPSRVNCLEAASDSAS